MLSGANSALEGCNSGQAGPRQEAPTSLARASKLSQHLYYRLKSPFMALEEAPAQLERGGKEPHCSKTPPGAFPDGGRFDARAGTGVPTEHMAVGHAAGKASPQRARRQHLPACGSESSIAQHRVAPDHLLNHPTWITKEARHRAGKGRRDVHLGQIRTHSAFCWDRSREPVQKEGGDSVLNVNLPFSHHLQRHRAQPPRWGGGRRCAWTLLDESGNCKFPKLSVRAGGALPTALLSGSKGPSDGTTQKIEDLVVVLRLRCGPAHRAGSSLKVKVLSNLTPFLGSHRSLCFGVSARARTRAPREGAQESPRQAKKARQQSS